MLRILYLPLLLGKLKAYSALQDMNLMGSKFLVEAENYCSSLPLHVLGQYHPAAHSAQFFT